MGNRSPYVIAENIIGYLPYGLDESELKVI